MSADRIYAIAVLVIVAVWMVVMVCAEQWFGRTGM
jgi:hypothetical protein